MEMYSRIAFLTLLLMAACSLSITSESTGSCNDLQRCVKSWVPLLSRGIKNYVDEYLIVVDPNITEKEQYKVAISLEGILDNLDLHGGYCATEYSHAFKFCAASLTADDLHIVKSKLSKGLIVVKNDLFSVDNYWKENCTDTKEESYRDVYKLRSKRTHINNRKYDSFRHDYSTTKSAMKDVLTNQKDYGHRCNSSDSHSPDKDLCSEPLILLLAAGSGVNDTNNQHKSDRIGGLFNYTDDETPFEENCMFKGIGTRTFDHILSKFYDDENVILFSLKMVNKFGLTRPSWILRAINDLIYVNAISGDNSITIATFTSIFKKNHLKDIGFVFDILRERGIIVVTHAASSSQAEDSAEYYPSDLPSAIIVESTNDNVNRGASSDRYSDIRYSARVFEEVAFTNSKRIGSKSYKITSPPTAGIVAIMISSLKNMNRRDFQSMISDKDKSKEFLLQIISNSFSHNMY